MEQGYKKDHCDINDSESARRPKVDNQTSSNVEPLDIILYTTHLTRPPSPQQNVIPASFESLRRWRRWRRWRWRRKSGLLYNPPGEG